VNTMVLYREPHFHHAPDKATIYINKQAKGKQTDAHNFKMADYDSITTRLRL